MKEKDPNKLSDEQLKELLEFMEKIDPENTFFDLTKDIVKEKINKEEKSKNKNV